MSPEPESDDRRHKELWPLLVPDHVTDGWPTNYLDLALATDLNLELKKIYQTIYVPFKELIFHPPWWFLIM